MCDPKCSQHCYSGDELGRVRYLENQNRELREKLRDARAEKFAFEEELNSLARSEKFPQWLAYQPHRGYLMGKIQRQADEIRKIQKVGWQPGCIIREVPYPDDEHLWDEPKVMSQKRVRKPPQTRIAER